MSYSDAELTAYLDEALPAERMAAIEAALRGDSALAGRLADINGRRGAGWHSIGEIWRRGRLSCPTREQLGSFLLGVLDEAWRDYLQFHLDVAGCRYCQANLDDLQRLHGEATDAATTRRRRYFQSSAGLLRKK